MYYATRKKTLRVALEDLAIEFAATALALIYDAWELFRG